MVDGIVSDGNTQKQLHYITHLLLTDILLCGPRRSKYGREPLLAPTTGDAVILASECSIHCPSREDSETNGFSNAMTSSLRIWMYWFAGAEPFFFKVLKAKCRQENPSSFRTPNEISQYHLAIRENCAHVVHYVS